MVRFTGFCVGFTGLIICSVALRFNKAVKNRLHLHATCRCDKNVFGDFGGAEGRDFCCGSGWSQKGFGLMVALLLTQKLKMFLALSTMHTKTFKRSGWVDLVSLLAHHFKTIFIIKA